MATFHPFLRLPLELRLEIWEMAAESEPRDLIFLRTRARPLFFGYSIVATQPAIVQVCHESRTAGTHEKAFQDGRRYLWVNFEIDTIQIPIAKYRNSKKFRDRTKIINLRLVGSTHDWFINGSTRRLRLFDRVKMCDYLLEGEGLRNRSLYIGRLTRQDPLAVRVIQADTGEYITPETFVAYLIWKLRSNSSLSDEYWDEQSRKFPTTPFPKESPSKHIVPWTCPIIR